MAGASSPQLGGASRVAPPAPATTPSEWAAHLDCLHTIVELEEGRRLCSAERLENGHGCSFLAIAGALPPSRWRRSCPLLLEVLGFKVMPLSVGKAQKAPRTPLQVHLTKELDAASAQFITMAFVVSSDTVTRPEPASAFQDSYPIHSPEGFRSLYRDAFGTPQGCPQTGLPTDWTPNLSRVLDTTQAM